MQQFKMCRYHNDLNLVKLPNFSEVQLNIFYGILLKMRDKKQGEKITFDAREVLEMIGGAKGRSSEDLLGIIISLFDKLAKADFKRLIEHKDSGQTQIQTVNLFKTESIFYYTTTLNFAKVDLEVNECFEYLLNELTRDYTEFEFIELMSVSGKYTKLLYTHLKQFRTTGKWLVKWEEFKNLLDIPPLLKPTDIDKILKATIKELTAERTLFDQKRIPFKNLKYQKLTKSGEANRKKLTPYFIEFSFTPQATTKILKDKLQGIRWVWDDKIYQVENVKKENGKIVVNCSRLNRETLEVERYDRRINFQTYEHAETTIRANILTLSQLKAENAVK